MALLQRLGLLPIRKGPMANFLITFKEIGMDCGQKGLRIWILSGEGPVYEIFRKRNLIGPLVLISTMPTLLNDANFF